MKQKGLEVKNHFVRRVFRKELNLRHKLIKRIPYLGNAQRSLVLRQQFAMQLLKLLDAGKRIINVDESVISCVDYRRKKWREHGTANSMPSKQIQPQISLIAAMDTEGSIYISLTQTIVDSCFFNLYLTVLANQLDVDRPDWRTDSVILLDGSRVHVSKETKA